MMIKVEIEKTNAQTRLTSDFDVVEEYVDTNSIVAMEMVKHMVVPGCYNSNGEQLTEPKYEMIYQLHVKQYGKMIISKASYEKIKETIC